MIKMTTSSLMMQAIATSLLAKVSTSLDDRNDNFKFNDEGNCNKLACLGLYIVR